MLSTHRYRLAGSGKRSAAPVPLGYPTWLGMMQSDCQHMSFVILHHVLLRLPFCRDANRAMLLAAAAGTGAKVIGGSRAARLPAVQFAR